MIWQPLNLTAACPAHTQVTACSPFGYIYLNLLVQLYGDSKDRRVQEKLRQKNDRDEDDEKLLRNIYKYGRRLEREKEEEYDFIVVGAGSAGCIIANRLSEVRNWKVLLLEAGPEQPDITLVPALATALFGSNIDWGYTTEPNGKSCFYTRGRCSWPRGKVMGGTSSINTMAYIRGSKLDYDNWAAMGNKGWSYKDVLPFFKKSEGNLNVERFDRVHHDINGPQLISRFPFIDAASIMLTEAFNQAGLPLTDYNGDHHIGTHNAQTFSAFGERISTNNAYIQPIRYKRKNLVVKINSEAVEILIDKHKKAYGVKYIRNGKINTALAKKEIIISGGTINSPKLLMLSGIGPKAQLDFLDIPVVENLAVGENLQDHVTFAGITIVLSNKTSTMVSDEEILEYIKEYKDMEIKEGPLTAYGPVLSLSVMKSNPDLPAPDLQFQFDRFRWREFMQEPTTYLTVGAMRPASFYDSVSMRCAYLTPKSKGRLVLNTTDPYAAPLIYANYFGVREDVQPLIKGTKILMGLEKTKAFRDSGAYILKTPVPRCKHFGWGTDDYIECLARVYTGSAFHSVGTCKMGPKRDKGAVVDPRLRVHGVSRLRVIDASVMPVIPRGNTNAPTMMIAEKGVEMIKEDWLNEYEKRIDVELK